MLVILALCAAFFETFLRPTDRSYIWRAEQRRQRCADDHAQIRPACMGVERILNTAVAARDYLHRADMMLNLPTPPLYYNPGLNPRLK